MWGRRSARGRVACVRAGVIALATCAVAAPASSVVVYLVKDAPDWNQPYQYLAPNGPGPNPSPGPEPFDAWCAPTAGANLIGYWEDGRGLPVADGMPFSAGAGAVPWPTPAIWHDRSLGEPRSAPGATPTLSPNDLGWWMDTNNLGHSGWGNGPHPGTYVKDIHAGLDELLRELAGLTAGLPAFWTTATRGASVALGNTPSGAAATVHASAGSAWAEIVDEIKADRPVLVHWSRWDIVPLGDLAPGTGEGSESVYGARYYSFSEGPSPEDPWGNDEQWYTDGDGAGFNLGHTTTAVGFIQAGDPEDIFAPGTPTDWVIVHDNAPGTPRNVIVPLSGAQYASGTWVGNTTVSPASPPAGVPALGAWGRGLLGAVLGVTLLAFASRRRQARG